MNYELVITIPCVFKHGELIWYDVYACAMYIVYNISKAQKGMSELLHKAVEEAKEGNTNIKQQVRDIGNKLLNSVQIHAQEAVYIVSSTAYEKGITQCHLH